MKRKALTLIIAATGVFALSATAQNPADPDCCDKKTECRAQNKKDGKCDRQAVLFKGITLTDEQKTAIENLDNQRALTRRDRQSEINKGKKDDTGLPSRDRVEQLRIDGRLDYLRQMQSILTPEQYVTYLENSVVYAPRFVSGHHGPKSMKKGTRRDGKKDMRRGDKIARHAERPVDNSTQTN